MQREENPFFFSCTTPYPKCYFCWKSNEKVRLTQKEKVITFKEQSGQFSTLMLKIWKVPVVHILAWMQASHIGCTVKHLVPSWKHCLGSCGPLRRWSLIGKSGLIGMDLGAWWTCLNSWSTLYFLSVDKISLVSFLLLPPHHPCLDKLYPSAAINSDQHFLPSVACVRVIITEMSTLVRFLYLKIWRDP